MANEKIDALLAIDKITIYVSLYEYTKSLRMRILEYAKEQCPEEDIDLAVFDTYDAEDWEYLLNRLRFITIKYYEDEFNLFPEQLQSWDGFELLFNEIEGAYYNDKPALKRTCKDCGTEFFIYQQEIEFYHSKGLSLPKRCKTCRRMRKLQSIKEDLDEAI